MNDKTYAVIMAGGRGERFWPLSTRRRPKQMLSLVGDRALVAQAVERLEGLIPPDRVYIITSQDLVAPMREAAPELPPANIIGEPMGRDTAAAAALGCALVSARDPDGVFCILTADHIIGKRAQFREALRRAMDCAARRDVLITIGISPTEPSTAYGYIEAGEMIDTAGSVAFYQTRGFVEKPNAVTARKYIDKGSFYWNSGMFIWSVEAFKGAVVLHHASLLQMMDAVAPTVGRPNFDKVLLREYEQLDKISIDYALMEKADNILMVRGEFEWDDVGSWTALTNHFDPDADGNVSIGRVATLDAKNNIVYSHDRLTALLGVEDLIVVQAEGATLVCPCDRAQDIKKMVTQLRLDKANRELL